MSKRGRGPGHAAPYGQACMHCFNSKSRCVSRPDNDGCERCFRLQKQCLPSDSVRRQKAQRPDPNARVAELEAKVEGLLSLLQSAAGSPNPWDSLSRASKALGANEAAQQIQGETLQAHGVQTPQPSSIGTSPDAVTTAVPSSGAGHAPRGPVNFDPTAPASWSQRSPEQDVTPGEADARLALFRDRLLPYCAFTAIPHTVSAREVRHEKPFLFRAIIAVTSPSAQQRMALGRDFKQLAAQHTLVDSQPSSMDLLLGLLTFIAWGYDHTLTKSASASRLMMLAMALAYDLRLNKPLPPDQHMIKPYVDHPMVDASGEARRWPLLERQRAVLGCFLLSCSVSSYFAQINPMPWTDQMNECLAAVGASTECSSDRVFAAQVRLQLMAQKADLVRAQISNDRASSSAPSALFYGVLHNQLDELRRSFPPTWESHDVIQLQTHYAELCISEAATATSASPQTFSLLNLLPADQDLDRLSHLMKSLGALKSWLANFLAVPPAVARGIPLPFAAQLARCLVVLLRMSMNAPTSAPTNLDTSPNTMANTNIGVLDPRSVREQLDLLDILSCVASLMELVGDEVGEQSSDDLFRRIAGMMRDFRGWAATRLDGGGEIESELEVPQWGAEMPGDTGCGSYSWEQYMPASFEEFAHV